jgi:hypothetical protein
MGPLNRFRADVKRVKDGGVSKITIAEVSPGTWISLAADMTHKCPCSVCCGATTTTMPDGTTALNIDGIPVRIDLKMSDGDLAFNGVIVSREYESMTV